MALFISRCSLLATIIVCCYNLEQPSRGLQAHAVDPRPTKASSAAPARITTTNVRLMKRMKQISTSPSKVLRRASGPLRSKGAGDPIGKSNASSNSIRKEGSSKSTGADDPIWDFIYGPKWSSQEKNASKIQTLDYSETLHVSNGDLLPTSHVTLLIDPRRMPPGCSLEQEYKETYLRCVSAYLTRIFPAILTMYDYITGIDISCSPQDKRVYLNPSYFVNSPTLKILGLFSCRVETIEPRTFAGLPNLEVLVINVRNIQKFGKNTFKGLRNLKKLSIFEYSSTSATIDDSADYAVSASFPEFLTGLTKLTYFSFSHLGANALTHRRGMENLFKGQANSLLEMGIKDSKLSNRHLHILKYLTNLRELDLRRNRLGYIQANSFPKLTNAALRLDHNNIMFIEVDSFRRMKNVTIQLQGNPFDCDCSNAGFSQWIRKYRSSASENGVTILGAESFKCAGPLRMYDKFVIDYDPYWWDCSPYVPLVALVFIVGFALIVASISMIVYCNWVNLRYWLLERRVAAKGPGEFGELEDRTKLGSILPHGGITRSSLRQGKTGAYVIYDFHDKPLLSWANKYLDDNLHLHPMKIDLQWPAGPEVSPLWKQVKDFSFQVHFFLVLVNEAFLMTHWPEIAEKSGVENIMKLVLVVFDKKKRDLPKELRRLQCPCLEWPETGTKFNNLERCRDLFWKELRLSLKCVSK